MGSKGGSARTFVAAFSALMCLVSLPTGTAYLLRWDDPAQPGQHPFLEGYLTMNGGKGGIAWDPGVSSEDNMPPAPAQYADATYTQKSSTERHMNRPADYNYGYTCAYTCTPGTPWYPATAGTTLTEGLPAPDEFVSAALPRSMYVNVTRGFQLTLYLQAHPEHANPCSQKYDMFPTSDYFVGAYSQAYWFEPSLDVEILVNGKPVAGGYANHWISWNAVYPEKKTPVNPTGYGSCRYQMHSELPFLEEGTVLTLRVRHEDQMYWYPYGLAGDHRSSLRIWEYPPEELYYRYPELDPSKVDGEADDEGGTGDSGARAYSAADTPPSPVEPLAPAIGGLLAFAGLTRAGLRRRSGPALVVGLLAASVMSGCLAGGGSGKAGEEVLQGQASNTLVVDLGGLTSEGLGAIIGLVHDDLHLPVKGVHVSVLGLGNFTETDSKGRFKFGALLPGTHNLRFDRTGYRSFQAEVEVKAGFVSRPDITLFLLNAKERDLRPHTHDYWNGADTKDLGTVTMTERCLDGVKRTCQLPLNYFRVEPKGDAPNTILPGTGGVEVTLNWNTGAFKADRIGLVLWTNQGNYTTLAPRGPGQAFKIPTTWEMTDIGHITYSSWYFYWVIPREEHTYAERKEMTDSGFSPGSITGHVTIKRGGVLPLEPAHPEHWGAETKLQRLKDFNSAFYIYGNLPPGQSWPCTTGQYGPDCHYMSYSAWGLGKNVIPQNSTWIELTMKQSRATGDPFPFGIKLYYRPANVQQVNLQTLMGMREVEPQAGGTLEKTVYRIPLKPEEADHYYAKSSAFYFTFRVTDETNAWYDSRSTGGSLCLVVCVGGVTPQPIPLQYTWNIWVHRDPMP